MKPVHNVLNNGNNFKAKTLIVETAHGTAKSVAEFVTTTTSMHSFSNEATANNDNNTNQQEDEINTACTKSLWFSDERENGHCLHVQPRCTRPIIN